MENQRELDTLVGAILGISLSVFSSVFYTMWDRLIVQKWDISTQFYFIFGIGISLLILMIYFTFRVMSLTKKIKPKEETTPKVNEGEAKTEVELMKVEIFSSHSQAMLNIFISLFAGLFFSGAAITWSRYSAGFITLSELNWIIGLGYAFTAVMWLLILRQYENRQKKIEKALIQIENGKRLPPLTELS
jgi:hypothetical protein